MFKFEKPIFIGLAIFTFSLGAGVAQVASIYAEPDALPSTGQAQIVSTDASRLVDSLTLLLPESSEDSSNLGIAGVRLNQDDSVTLYWKGEVSPLAKRLLATYPMVNLKVVHAPYSYGELVAASHVIMQAQDFVQQYSVTMAMPNLDGSGVTIGTADSASEAKLQQLQSAAAELVDMKVFVTENQTVTLTQDEVIAAHA